MYVCVAGERDGEGGGACLWRLEANIKCILQLYTTIFLKQHLSLNLMLTNLARLPDQRALRILSFLLPWCWDCRYMP